MTKDEFSVNELEPERNTNEVVEETTQIEYTEGSDAAYLNQGAMVIDDKKQEELISQEVEQDENQYQGPTIKEVLVNSVNPDYQGPTAKEIVVNSVKVDNTKKKNYVGLFVLILVLVLIGIIVIFELSSDDNGKKKVNYLVNTPKWVESYNDYLNKKYKDLVAYNLAFLDLDFDNKPEALVNYIKDDETVYEVVDAIDGNEFEVNDVSNVLMMYSFINQDINWYVNYSDNDVDLRLIDVAGRLDNESNYEYILSGAALSDFKSNHFNLSYQIKYTKISFRTYEKNLAEAVKVYEKEAKNIDNIVNTTIDKYAENA